MVSFDVIEVLLEERLQVFKQATTRSLRRPLNLFRVQANTERNREEKLFYM